jgi:sulfur transfer complex TusBCD TusB component (DsrH family)
MAKILSIVETAYRGILEEQDDTILWVNAMFKKGGADLSFLLRSNAVNYAVKGQDTSGLQIGSITQKHAPDIAGDLAQIVGSGAPVYVVSEDLQERGIQAMQLVDGVKPVSRKEIPGLFDQHEQVWHW